jgi:hypothetical protein
VVVKKADAGLKEENESRKTGVDKISMSQLIEAD